MLEKTLILEQRLQAIAQRLTCLSRIPILPTWQIANLLGSDTANQEIAVDEKGIFRFGQGIQEVRLQQVWQAPAKIEELSLQGTTMRLSLRWWASLAEIFINGTKVHEGDLFDAKCRLLLASDISAFSSFIFAIRLKSPKHDRGALQQSEIIIEYPHQPCDPGKFAQELKVIRTYLPILAQRSASFASIEKAVAKLELLLNASVKDTDLQELAKIRRSLAPIGKLLKQRKVYLLGNAHIDVAWLWDIAETREVVQRTFKSVLDLQSQYPELIFNQSTALTYEWLEQDQPELFEQIKTAVEQQKCEPTGGMWVEPDCNLPSGESLIRQILYGKNYFRCKFNRDIKIAWLPDTFGFNWQLPQILAKSGFMGFITQKLTWNDTNKFPQQIFWWQGLDGSKILTYFSNELGLDIEPEAIAKFLSHQEQIHGIKHCLWLYGIGDHGGGPTADMLDQGREWAKSDLFFTLAPSTAEDYMLNLKQELENPKNAKTTHNSIPIYQDELYLEFHRGVYTTKADQKRQHRQAEILIGNVEKYRAIATLLISPLPLNYPRELLEKAWKGLLVNQFHDILTGTSIPEVFTDANETWDEVKNICHILIQGMNKLDWYRDKNQYGINIWNFNNWSRSELVEIKYADLGDIHLSPWDLSLKSPNSAELLPTQATAKGLLFRADDVPSLGSQHFTLVQRTADQPMAAAPALKISSHSLENQYLQLTIDPQSGEISQICGGIHPVRNRHSGKQLLSRPCELQFFADEGQYWDAWNIDPDYESKKREGLTLESITIQEEGELRASIQVIRHFGRSQFRQEIQLEAHSPYITVKNWVDWQEEHILVKVAFPLSFSAPFATYEIPMGTIQRSTLAETLAAKAKFEVPAQFWADMSGDGVGLSILNDCKYGYDAKPDQLRLTLLRSPHWPSPNSDQGIHEFTYRLVPHDGNWQAANIVRLGYELNNPLAVYPQLPNQEGDRFSFLSTTSSNIILSALKSSEDGHSWILRFYESCGQPVRETITTLLQITALQECDLMENAITNVGSNLEWSDRYFACNFQPYEIKTFSIRFSDK